MERVERDVMLQMVDQQWKDHLYSLDHLKEGIGLRGYGQRDPLVEYKKESFELFQAMKLRVDDEIVRFLWRLRPVLTEEGGEPPIAAAPCAAPAVAADSERPERGAGTGVRRRRAVSRRRQTAAAGSAAAQAGSRLASAATMRR